MKQEENNNMSDFIELISKVNQNIKVILKVDKLATDSKENYEEMVRKLN